MSLKNWCPEHKQETLLSWKTPLCNNWHLMWGIILLWQVVSFWMSERVPDLFNAEDPIECWDICKELTVKYPFLVTSQVSSVFSRFCNAFSSKLLIVRNEFRIVKWHLWRCISCVLKSEHSSMSNCGFFWEFAVVSMY